MELILLGLVAGAGFVCGIIAGMFLQRRRQSPQPSINEFVDVMLPLMGWHDFLSKTINRVIARTAREELPLVGNYLVRKSGAKAFHNPPREETVAG